MFFTTKKPKIGIALGAGGARGFAHLGVLKALQKHNIPIDIIAGSSAGAFIGSLFATKKNLQEIEDLMLSINGSKVLSFLWDPSFSQGISQGKKFKQFFEETIGNQNFEDLETPFAVVTTDLKTGSEIVLKQGKIADAAYASASIPFLFKPVERDDLLLIDGGVSNPVPVRVARDMGADIVIAINLCYEYFLEDFHKNMGLTGTFLQSYNIMSHHLAQEQLKDADIAISPLLKHIRWKLVLSNEEKKEIIALGEQAMEEQIETLKKLIGEKNTPGWKKKIQQISHHINRYTSPTS